MTVEQDAAFLASVGEVPSERFRLLSISALAELPPPTWVIDGLIPSGLSVLFGPSGVGKSFLALDWALSVASGDSWCGQAARAGMVLYVAAEGASGLHQRIAAWTHAREVAPPDRISFLPAALNFLDVAEVEAAAEVISRTIPAPSLIVIDTMARSMVGGDENSAKDVGRFIASVDQLRARFSADALIVHHTGKDGEGERGSSALRGAADAMLTLKPDGSGARLECVKQKDAPEFDTWRLHLATVRNSCVFRSGTNSAVLSAAERRILAEVSAAFGTDWATPRQIQEAVSVPRSSYYRALRTLTERGLIEVDGEGRFATYRLTEAGARASVSGRLTPSHETDPTVSSHSPLYGTVRHEGAMEVGGALHSGQEAVR